MRDKLLATFDEKPRAENARSVYAEQLVHMGLAQFYGVYLRRRHGQFWLYLRRYNLREKVRT